MSLLPFFQWMNGLALSQAVRSSDWLGATNNLLHLLSLVLFAGGIVVVDLRLIGRGLTQAPVSQVARNAQPWMMAGLVGLFLTGIPALTASAMTQYSNSMFWRKMEILLVGLIFTLTVRRRITRADEARIGPWGKVVGLVLMALWATVAFSARMISFR